MPKETGLISFRMDWLDLLAVQGTLKSLLQHHCSGVSVSFPPFLSNTKAKVFDFCFPLGPSVKF